MAFNSRINVEECVRLNKEGMSYAALARRYGVSRVATRKVCLIAVKSASVCKRQDELNLRRERIIDLFSRGDNPKTIAWKVGCTLSTVYRHLPPIKSEKSLRLRFAYFEAHQCS